jgi:hypothetical protein
MAQHEPYTVTLSSRTSEIGRLALLVEKLQRTLFGTKSEKVLRQIEQLEFQLDDLQVARARSDKPGRRERHREREAIQIEPCLEMPWHTRRVRWS